MKDTESSEKMRDTGAVNEATSVMRALSNPSRLRLLVELSDGERSVGELENALGTGQAYVSQQLARLRADDIVSARRQGRIVYYSIRDPRVTPVLNVLCDQFCA